MSASRRPAHSGPARIKGGGGKKRISKRGVNPPFNSLRSFESHARYESIIHADELQPFLAGTRPRVRRPTGMDAAADLQELTAAPQAIAKVRYSHVDMIDFIIANPGVTQRAIAARYGYTESWLSLVMSSDAWQSAMAARRAEMVDPTLAATIDERFRGLTLRSLDRLMQKLDAPQVSDNVVLKAVELGAKAMGVGGNAPPPAAAADHLAQLANRLIDLQSKIRQGITVEGEVVPDA